MAEQMSSDPEGAAWLGATHLEDSSARAFVTVLDLLHRHGGQELVTEFAGKRFRELAQGALLGPIYRGWLRSYSGALVDVMRVLPYIWAAATRHCGTLHVVPTGANRAVMELRDAPDFMLQSLGLRDYCAGHVRALLEPSPHTLRYRYEVIGQLLRVELEW